MANPTTNYSFAMPTNTDLVKDLPADFETFGQAVDSKIKDLNPETTAGDISYRGSTANAKTRLAIGTAGQVLTVNSGATAPEWAAVAAGSNWSLLNSGGTALTGATTITVSGISNKDKIMVLIAGASSANGSSSFTLRFNADSGNNYSSYGLWRDSSQNAAQIINNFTNTATSSIPFAKMFGGNYGTASGGLTLTGGNASGVKAFIYTGSASSGGGESGQESYSGQGFYSGSSTISSVSIISSTGNFDAGTIYVYTSA